jgi:hypothetical protein
LWYRRVDAELKVNVAASPTKRAGSDSHVRCKQPDNQERRCRLPAEAIDAIEEDTRDENVELGEAADADETGEAVAAVPARRKPAVRRKRVEEVTLGGAQDPFLKSASARDRIEVGSGASSATVSSAPRQRQIEVSAIAADFRALRRSVQRVRLRILHEAPWRSWYAGFVQLGKVDPANVDDLQLDEMWVWLMALQQTHDDPPIDLPSALEELAYATMRNNSDRLRPTLARLLGIMDTQPAASDDDRCIHCPGLACVLRIVIGLLGKSYKMGEADNIRCILPILHVKFDVKGAKMLFEPTRKVPEKRETWSSVLISGAFGAIFAHVHLVRSKGVAAANLSDLQTRLVSSEAVVAECWSRLAAFYMGAVWHLEGAWDVATAFADFQVLAAAAPGIGDAGRLQTVLEQC